MSYKIINGKVFSAQDYPNIQTSSTKVNTVKTDTGKSFKDVLNDTVAKKESFTISNHAAERLKNRNISLNSTDMKNINEGINKAEEKGSKDCVIFYKDVAFVTSIKNRTIITAVDKDSGKGNVFTNIDSVVML